MSDNETVSFEEGYRLLETELAGDTPAPEEQPSHLKLNQIRLAHSVFQPRGFEDTASSEEHVRVLMDAALSEPHNQLDPITVWWSGKFWRVIDGHHRFKAYQRLRQKKLATPEIPVSVFEGTLMEALIESTKLNSKDKLPMSRDDKMNRAWKMVIIGGDFSKRIIADACKVGTATVARMRSKLNQIREAEPEEWSEVVSEMTWKEAQRYGQGERLIDDAWQEKTAREWARRLGKTFGKKPTSQPEIMWRALELYSPRMVEAMQEHLTPIDLENGDF